MVSGRMAVAVLLAVVLAAAAGCGGGDAARPAPTTRVERGSVAITVAAPGAVAAVTSDGFQVVAPFQESDAVKVKPNQHGRVSFDAIPDLVRDGRVLAVAPTGTTISGTTNYYVTIVSTETDPRLRQGQTARATVFVAEVDNVPVVPNTAVVKQGGRSFVNTPGPDGKPVRVPFQPGMVGADTTQVLSGLREGQTVVLPR